MDANDQLTKEVKHLVAAMNIAASILATAQDIGFTHAQKNGVMLVVGEWLKKQTSPMLRDLYNIDDVPF